LGDATGRGIVAVVVVVVEVIVPTLTHLVASLWQLERRVRHSRKIKGDVQAQVMARGGGKEQLDDAAIEALTVGPPKAPREARSAE
jgi:hypothetical protein